MKCMRKWLFLSLAGLVSIVIVAALLEPNQVLVGLLRGDEFYDFRPTTYWREILRNEGSRECISDETLATFKYRESAIPVLRACAIDSDPKVRWPAVVLLGNLARLHVHVALPALRDALHDDDMSIRLHAIHVLENLGPNAMIAASDLVPLLKDPVPQVQFLAEKALWNVHKKLAIESGGWRTFESPRWSFSVSFPSAPSQEQKPNPLVPDRLTIHSFTSRHGVTTCTVAVTEYPVDLFKGTDNERLDAGRGLMLFGIDAKLAEEKDVDCGVVKGREFTVEKTIERDVLANTFVLRSRVFWLERRQYQIVAVYSPSLSVIPAVDYFLDSFEFR